MKHLRVLPKMLVIECAYLQHDTLYRGHPLQHQVRHLKVFSRYTKPHTAPSSAPRILMSCATSTYNDQFLNAQHNNYLGVAQIE